MGRFDISPEVAAEYTQKYKEAAAFAQELAEKFPGNRRWLVQAACGFALSSAAVPDTEPELKEEYLRRSIECLNRAADQGFDDLAILERDPVHPRSWRARDFVGGLNLASGFAFGHGGVFVLQAPYLLFYPDGDGNDVPDRDPDVLLSGFGMEDAHSVANSLTWGPDGWLYGCQGSTVTAKIRGIESAFTSITSTTST